MNRFRIGAVLLAVLLGLCVWAQLRLSAIQTPIAQAVTQAEAYAAQEDWAQAAEMAAQAQRGWEENRTFVASLADHQPLEEIESLFAMLKTYSDQREKTEFRAVCQDLARRILAVKQAHELTLGSLF